MTRLKGSKKIDWDKIRHPIVEQVKQGCSLQEIADKYNISPHTLMKQLYAWRVGNLHMSRLYPLSFSCRYCSAHVVTDPMHGDKRTVFCCEHCQRKFWRKYRYQSGSIVRRAKK